MEASIPMRAMKAPAKAPLSGLMLPTRTAALAVLVAVALVPERVAEPDAPEPVALEVPVPVADAAVVERRDVGNADDADANNSALE